MAIPSPIPTASLVLTLFSLLLLLSPPSAADVSNVLLTGDVLATNSQLNYRDSAFVIQDDCNLVLYNKGRGFQSNTHGNGVNCSVTLSNRGKFVILSADGSTVWTSSPPSPTKPGNYAAVLRPDGEVFVYGPSVWSVPVSKPRAAAAGEYEAELQTVLPMVSNVLFSDQTLYGNARLATRDYSFVMKDDCNLTLVKASVDLWDSGTRGKGQHCFVRLDHRGELAVEDDRYRALWSSKAVSTEGDYVLVLQINGQAVVYGPVVWSTPNGI